MTTVNFERLKEHILLMSEAKSFESARAEWDLVAVEISEEFDYCPCGQQIKEHCYIRNRLNHNQTYVGNICINRFIQIDTGNLFDGLKRISLNISAKPNKDLIEYANSHGYLYGEKEYKFLMQISKKRKLSEAQISWIEKINRRIVLKTVVQKRTDR